MDKDVESLLEKRHLAAFDCAAEKMRILTSEFLDRIVETWSTVRTELHAGGSESSDVHGEHRSGWEAASMAAPEGNGDSLVRVRQESALWRKKYFATKKEARQAKRGRPRRRVVK